jgi:zinc transport system substrate-binding protein
MCTKGHKALRLGPSFLASRLLGLTMAVVCSGSLSAAGTPEAGTQAVVSILPQAYLVERIAGPYVDVEVLVGPGQSPETYEPTPKQMARLGRSRVYFRIGVPFEEAFVRKIPLTAANLSVVDMRQGVPLRYFLPSGSNRAPDPHIWLDPKRAKLLAYTACFALRQVAPAHEAVFRKNLLELLEDLDQLDRTIARELACLKGRRVYVFHPAFGYFCESYGLTQIAVEVQGKEPTAKQLVEIIARARRDGTKSIFVQPQHASRDAEAIAREIGAGVVLLDPLPRNYLEGLEEMATRIKTALL